MYRTESLLACVRRKDENMRGLTDINKSYILLKYTCGLPRIQQTKGKKCVVYSFGVERESSWEAEILERTDCEIFMYDYSVTKVRYETLAPN